MKTGETIMQGNSELLSRVLWHTLWSLLTHYTDVKIRIIISRAVLDKVKRSLPK